MREIAEQTSSQVVHDADGIDLATIDDALEEAVRRVGAILAAEANAVARVQGRSIVIENFAGRAVAVINLSEAIGLGETRQ